MTITRSSLYIFLLIIIFFVYIFLKTNNYNLLLYKSLYTFNIFYSVVPLCTFSPSVVIKFCLCFDVIALCSLVESTSPEYVQSSSKRVYAYLLFFYIHFSHSWVTWLLQNTQTICFFIQSPFFITLYLYIEKHSHIPILFYIFIYIFSLRYISIFFFSLIFRYSFIFSLIFRWDFKYFLSLVL